jgi:5-dehydro-2-deoxygluconokinase
VGGDAGRYDDELRPDLTRRAAGELVQSGLAPQLWKLEGMPTTQDYVVLAQACGADGVGSACLVLGRGADEAAVDRWLTLAAPVAGFAGFAVGRTLWWDALKAVTSGAATAAEGAARIAANYLRLIDVYLQAADGGRR